MFAAWSTDGAASFGAPVRIDDGAPLGRVSVVLLPDGAMAVAWLEVVGEDGAMRLRRVTPDGRLHRAITLAITAPTRPAGFPRLGVVPEGVLAAWTAPADSGVRVRLVRRLP